VPEDALWEDHAPALRHIAEDRAVAVVTELKGKAAGEEP
jgi:hypothetical protein